MDLLVVEVHVQAVDILDSPAEIQEDSCKEQEGHLDDHLDDHLDVLLDVHLEDHLDVPLDDQLVEHPDPQGVVEVDRADQDQAQAPDLRTLHCSCCEPVRLRFLIKTF